MTKRNFSIVAATVGLLLSVAILLSTMLQHPFPSFAAGATPTPKDKGKGPAVGAKFSYTDLESGLQDTETVESRSNGQYIIDVNMPGSSSYGALDYRFTYGDPYAAGPSEPLLRNIQVNNYGTFSNIALNAVPPATLATEDQLDEGQNSTLKTIAASRTRYYRDGYVTRVPYPITTGSVNQWEVQIYDATLGRLRTLAMNDTTNDARVALATIRTAVDNQATAERSLASAITLLGLGFVTGLFNTAFTQTGKDKETLRTELALLASIVLLGNAIASLYNNLPTILRQHETALVTFSNILQHGWGGAHELTPLTATPTPRH